MLDLRIAHDRFRSSSDPSLNGHLHYPNDIDKSLIEVVSDKIRKYRTDYNNNPPTSVIFEPVVSSTTGRLHSEFVVDFYSYRFVGKLTVSLNLQEFIFLNTTVDSSTSSTRLNLSRSSPGLSWFSLKIHLDMLCL